MQTNRSRGFTLIELLVVIAIIGILSAVVLASLSTARTKGQDAAVQSDFNTIQTQSEIDYGANGNSYGTQGESAACSTLTTAGTPLADVTVQNALKGIKSVNGGTDSECVYAGSSYAVAGALASTGKYWCIDSTGVSRGTTAAGVTYSGILGASPAAYTAGTGHCN